MSKFTGVYSVYRDYISGSRNLSIPDSFNIEIKGLYGNNPEILN